MGAVNLDRDELQGLLESPETRQRVRKLLELQYRKDSEVGGELYLRGRSRDSLFFRVIPSWFEYLIGYIKTDLVKGNYKQRKFSKLKSSFMDPDYTDRGEVKRLLEEMGAFESRETRELKDAKRISTTVLEILSRRYEKPAVGLLRKGLYAGDFHVHWNGEIASENDKPSGGDPPELVIIRDSGHRVKFSYLYMGRYNRARRYNFGPYRL